MKHPSAGAYYLSAIGLPGPALGKELGVSRMTVSYWLSGERRPAAAMRAKIQARWKWIAPKLWDVPYDEATHKPQVRVVVNGTPNAAPAPPPGAAPPIGVDVPQGIFAKADMLERTVAKLLAEAEANVSLSMAERATVAVKVADALERLAKIRGEWELSKRLFKTPAWREACEAMRRALTGYPEAARRVAIELAKVDRRHTHGDAAADAERAAQGYFGIGAEE